MKIYTPYIKKFYNGRYVLGYDTKTYGKTGDSGHATHAVAVEAIQDDGTVKCLNSWGKNQQHLSMKLTDRHVEVSEVEIIEVRKWDGVNKSKRGRNLVPMKPYVPDKPIYPDSHKDYHIEAYGLFQ